MQQLISRLSCNISQERKVKVRAYLDNLSKENKQLQETHAAMEITAKDAVAARNYMEQHRNQLESALYTAKDQVMSTNSLLLNTEIDDRFDFLVAYFSTRRSWMRAQRSGTRWRTGTTTSSARKTARSATSCCRSTSHRSPTLRRLGL